MLIRALILSLTLLSATLTGACQRTNAPGKAPKPSLKTAPRVLRFGSGGGFVGTTTSYSLYTDGRLERRRGAPADTTQPATLLVAPPPGPVARCFQALDALPADSLTLRQPGNMYYFLVGQTATGRRVDLTWGASGVVAPAAVRALYRQLEALVPLRD